MMVNKASSSMFAAVHEFTKMAANGSTNRETFLVAATAMMAEEADEFLEMNPNFVGRDALGFLSGYFNNNFEVKYQSEITKFGGSNPDNLPTIYDIVIPALDALGNDCNAPEKRLVIKASKILLEGGELSNNPEEMFPLIEQFLEIEPKNLTPEDGDKNRPSTFFGIVAVLYNFELWYDNKYGISHASAQNTSSQNNTQQSTSQSSGGCYVATAVYGSYDCPEVWTLRRYRDYSLSKTFFGRAFIKTYYAISPTLVKWFGGSKWFKTMWKVPLDKMVKRLNEQGYENTNYYD